jgi:hypothetical protein
LELVGVEQLFAGDVLVLVDEVDHLQKVGSHCFGLVVLEQVEYGYAEVAVGYWQA